MKARRKSILLLILATIVIIIVVAILVVQSSHEEKLVWLDVGETARVTTPGRFERLKQRLRLLPVIAPLWRHREKERQYYRVYFKLLKISKTDTARLALPAPDATNSNGLRAWLVPQPGLDDLGQCLKEIASSGTFMTGWTMSSDGFRFRLGPGSFFTVASWGTNSLSIDGIPDRRAGSVGLRLAVTGIETLKSSTAATQSLKTNLVAGLRTVIPTGGALLLDCGDFGGVRGEHAWVLLSPTNVITDVQGNPIKQ